VELESPDAEFLDLPRSHRDALGAARRVHAAERDEDVGVVAGPLGDLFRGRPRRVVRRAGVVDRERDGRHVPLAVVGGQVVDGEGRRRRLEVLRHRGEVLVLVRAGRRGVHGPVHMSVHINRDQVFHVHAGDYPVAFSLRHAMITPIYDAVNLWVKRS
jgi:hypothetical protein